MMQAEKRIFLIRSLLDEQPRYWDTEIPQGVQEQKQLLRALFNLRPPKPASERFLKVQDEYLKTELCEKGITDYRTLTPTEDGIYLWQGDITTLKCDAIVNAANAQMLGCFYPNHGCVDNAIHTYAGIELRLACDRLMKEQGCEEETGRAKITPAYNLPSSFVLHTVGPLICGKLTKADEDLLASCYRSCLGLAGESGVRSIAFCCISTGEFHFPNDKAARVAVQTVRAYKRETNSQIEVIFNVFKQMDYEIYRKLLG